MAFCQNCRLRSVDCTYAGERRAKRWMQAGIDPRRFSVIRNPQDHHGLDGADAHQGREIAVHPRAVAAASEAPASSTSNLSTQNQARKTQQERDVDMVQPQTQWCQMESDPMACDFDHMANDICMGILQTPSSSNVTEDESLLDKILDGDDTECTKDRNPALWMRASDGDEYTGPSSGISTISDLGLNWVRQNVSDSQVLCETIQDIRNGILNHLRQPKCIPQVLPLALATPCDLEETPDSLLSRYVEAYFDTVQVIFPILDRDKFLSQLEEFGTGRGMAQNPSWQALLNAVLASGCRAALSAETAEAFKESGRKAWGYFHNALSFESRILHGSTDLMAVQAMAVMTVFAQGTSSPQRLEYTICSIASRLAQSLALNRHPPPEWNLTEEEQRERNRVFWVIYCLDRRPSCGDMR
ncbi:Fungal specific transcription factor domain containing protein [Pleurostoma richardsiae]|uniref:Fungal specific transcription factor domain containing protein n=1 Tax=Pleurostoma richardsiae TaxID=41990 RepID=A0AA38RD77_9PEZI|nr:Fungal specific transcription factor domain containing protein [Pleurostoma richardsiae]